MAASLRSAWRALLGKTKPWADKWKVSAKRNWDNLDTRVQGTIIQEMGKIVFVVIPAGAPGYLFLQGHADKLKTVEKDLLATKLASAKMEAHQAKTEESIAQYGASFAQFREETDLKFEKIKSEIRDLKIKSEIRDLNHLKEKWMAKLYQSRSRKLKGKK